MLGAGASVVGRSRYCDHPREVERIPQVGGFTDPNLEAILALRPELVVEVTFDHVSSGRIRHGTKVQRWRDDKDPRSCTVDQLLT